MYQLLTAIAVLCGIYAFLNQNDLKTAIDTGNWEIASSFIIASVICAFCLFAAGWYVKKLEKNLKKDDDEVITMGNLDKCSSCGNSDSVDVRFAACIATSQYDKVNYPAPNTVFTNCDNIQMWRIPLCRTCMPNGYRSFLCNHLKNIKEMLGWLFLVLISFSLMLHFFPFDFSSFGRIIATVSENNSDIKSLVGISIPVGKSIVSTLLNFAFFLGLIASIIGIPVYIVKWLVNFILLKGLERSGIVPAKKIDKSFIGEGQRIMNVLTSEHNKSSEKVWGEFLLPAHKTKNQLDLTPAEYGKLGIPTHERDILVVGKTIDEVVKQLPLEWKSLWKK